MNALFVAPTGTSALRAELVALFAVTSQAPLVESARCLALAAQTELDALAPYEAASLMQLETNRDVTLAATGVLAADVLAVSLCGVEVLSACKLLEHETASELVAADDALERVGD